MTVKSSNQAFMAITPQNPVDWITFASVNSGSGTISAQSVDFPLPTPALLQILKNDQKPVTERAERCYQYLIKRILAGQGRLRDASRPLSAQETLQRYRNLNGLANLALTFQTAGVEYVAAFDLQHSKQDFNKMTAIQYLAESKNKPLAELYLCKYGLNQHWETTLAEEAVRGLRHTSQPATIDWLRNALEQNPVAFIRMHAATALSGTRDSAAVESLVNFGLQDEFAAVRQMTVGALKETLTPAVAHALWKRFDNPKETDQGVRQGIIFAFKGNKDPVNVKRLIALFTDSASLTNQNLAIAAIQALEHTTSKIARRALINSGLGNPDTPIQEITVKSLHGTRLTSVIKTLAAWLNDFQKPDSLRDMAAYALGQSKNKLAEETLLHTLEVNSDPIITRTIFLALCSSRQPAALKCLAEHALFDPLPDALHAATDGIMVHRNLALLEAIIATKNDKSIGGGRCFSRRRMLRNAIITARPGLIEESSLEKLPALLRADWNMK